VTCSNCGTDNRAGRRFCVQCASPLGGACPACGTPADPEDKFCGSCATPLRAGSGAVAGANPASSARQAPSSSASPVAERRLVSVLFADLVGFTPFAEERDPEAVRDVLSRYFDTAREVVERHGGSIEKFIGDAVMAVWGTPVAHEDDAERAVRAGLELVDAVRGLAPEVEARAGVMTGEAAVNLAAVGQGMVAGDLVNTAARLQSIAPPGAVLVGEATMRLTTASIVFESAGEHSLKGKSTPISAWHAQRVIAQRGGRGRTEILEPPFVGRDEELRLLKDLLHATGRERRARLVSITGPAGIGKSRLVWELEKYLDGVVESVYWHRGRSPSYGDGITFWALGEMVRRRAGLAENDDEDTTRARIGETVDRWVTDEADRRWVEPALLTLLGLEPAPAGGRDVLFAAWRIFFEQVAEQGTTVLLFEDLHWADTGLLDFVDHLLEWSRDVPILIVTLARPELFDRRPNWGVGVRQFTAIALEPLSDDAMRELLAGLVPALPDAAVGAILDRADGMPLYAVEIVRSLIADGRLVRSGEVYQAVGELGELTVPETLRSLITSRLDALEPADRMLLQHASVLGHAFTLANLSAITEIPGSDLQVRLRDLVRREVLELEADPRSPERGQYRFVQSLIREVAYGTLSRRDRRTWHLAVARHYEGIGDEETAGALASHYLAAYQASAEGDEARAVAGQARIALRSAADRAMSLGAHDQAVSFAEQALSVTTDPGERADLLERAARSSAALARYDAAHAYAQSAVDARQETGDLLGVGRARAILGETLLDASRIPDAIASLEAALAELGRLARVEGLGDVEAAVRAQLSRGLMRAGDDQRAIAVADAALAWAEPHNLAPIIADSFINKGSALGNSGRRREGVALLEAAVHLADAGGLIIAGLRSRNNLGSILIDNDPARSLEAVREARELALRVGNRGMANWLCGSAALWAYPAGSEWDAELAALDEAIAATGATAPADRNRILGIETTIRIARGEDASASIAELEDLFVQVGEPAARLGMALVRGSWSAAQGRFGEAFDEFWLGADAFPAYEQVVLPSALHAALWLRDPARIRSFISRVEASPLDGRVIQARLTCARAGLAALEGDPRQAVAGFEQALAQLRDLGQAFEVALGILDAIHLLSGEDEVRSWADEARATFERVRAGPSLARLDAALAGTDPGSAHDAPGPSLVMQQVDEGNGVEQPGTPAARHGSRGGPD
jgi:class 3 adenylate cyclase/tetratricopeptide (TPR) repeat protein